MNWRHYRLCLEPERWLMIDFHLKGRCPVDFWKCSQWIYLRVYFCFCCCHFNWFKSLFVWPFSKGKCGVVWLVLLIDPHVSKFFFTILLYGKAFCLMEQSSCERPCSCFCYVFMLNGNKWCNRCKDEAHNFSLKVRTS